MESLCFDLQTAQWIATSCKCCHQGFRPSRPKTALPQPLGSTLPEVTWRHGSSQPRHQMLGLMLTPRWPAERPQCPLLAAVQHRPLPCLQVPYPSSLLACKSPSLFCVPGHMGVTLLLHNHCNRLIACNRMSINAPLRCGTTLC